MDRVSAKAQRVGHVFYNGRFAGVLAQTETGYHFTYDEAYLAGGLPIAFTLPLQRETFVSERLHSFFENLVSEGWMRNLQSQEQKIDENDRFGLLLANGLDLIGAVTVERAIE